MDHDDFTNDPRADALDKALDALAQGNRHKMRKLEPGMRETVDRMFTLAEVAGMTPAPAINTPHRSRIRQFVRPPMTWLSAAAVIVLLAVMVNRTFPESPLNSGSFGTMVVTPDASRDVTQEVPPPDYPVINTAPLEASECVIDPRPRDQVAAILGAPPENGSDILPVLYRTTFSEIPWDAIQQSYREWQACLKNGRTYQAMALETSQFIREDAYGRSAMLGLPFSDSTIDAILDAREAQDALWLEQGSAFTTNGKLLMIMPEGTIARSDDGTVVMVQVAWYNTQTGQRESPPVVAVFQLVNDTWQLARYQVPVTPVATDQDPDSVIPTVEPTVEVTLIPLDRGDDNQGTPTIVPTISPSTGEDDQVRPTVVPTLVQGD